MADTLLYSQCTYNFHNDDITMNRSPFSHIYANISFIIKDKRTDYLEENEFKFLVATAIQTIHGEVAGHVDVLKFTSISPNKYSAIIRFKTIHYSRIITSLLLFGSWQQQDCKFNIIKVAQTPCILAL